MPRPANRWLLLLPFLLHLTKVSSECKVQHCTSIYRDTVEEKRIVEGANVPFCQVLVDYGACLKTVARDCRGDIYYLSSNTAVRSLLNSKNCSSLVGLEKVAPEAPRPRPSIIPELPPNEVAPTSAPHRYCTFHGSGVYRYCGLFGDPHLKTFYNHYQTCRVHGAWPLIDNPYLAVQVTNEPVVEGSPATVTTKVTIIIKGSKTRCTTEKTYEATSEQPLADVFTDGSRRSGHNGSVSITLEDIDDDHQSVEILLHYIKTTIVVRQVRKYLAFAIQMPDELVQLETQGGLPLCGSGCPETERLNLDTAHGRALSWKDAVELCRDTSYLAKQITNNLTDHYLDWCVFDVMTTGAAEADAFTSAAHSAQADALRFEPQALANRTEPKLLAGDLSSSAPTPVSRIFSWLVVTAAVTWLRVMQFVY